MRTEWNTRFSKKKRYSQILVQRISLSRRIDLDVIFSGKLHYLEKHEADVLDANRFCSKRFWMSYRNKDEIRRKPILKENSCPEVQVIELRSDKVRSWTNDGINIAFHRQSGVIAEVRVVGASANVHRQFDRSEPIQSDSNSTGIDNEPLLESKQSTPRESSS